ncbi:MAG: fibronectin type III-like domain-contianing protein [Candidatus Thorarchaeota archaeon]
MKAQDLAFYDASKHDWVIEAGEFKLLVGKSSREILGETNFVYQ